jgi:VIT1/CCC1 family predicted Fe2+/Mn2+ transporter
MEPLLKSQKDEATGYQIYLKLSGSIRNPENAALLKRIADNEKQHYEILKKYTKRDISADWIKVFIFFLIGKTLGLSFALKLLENEEKNAQKAFGSLKDMEELKSMMEDEERHERELINLVNEKRLNYMGSIVLGLNDALVELTGALAGYTFAMQNSRLIGIIGLITGIAASLSMASSQYLSKKQEEEENSVENPVLSSLFTGIAYIITVILLVLPFFLLPNHFISLGISLAIAILIIYFFNFYISTAKDLPFFKRFFQMSLISLGVAALSFGIGVAVKTFIGVDI